MAISSDATRSLTAPIVILSYPGTQDSSSTNPPDSGTFGIRETFLSTVRRALAAGKMVLIRGWKPQNPVQFNSNEVLSWRGSLSQPVQWQGSSFSFFFSAS